MWKLQENILEEKDKEFLVEFIRSTDRFTQFQKVKAFEAAWSSWQQCRYSTFVNSGSSADLIMLDAVKEFYQIPDNAEVLVPAVTWTTNITSVIQVGLKPIFVDVNLNDFSFDYEKLEKAITKESRIILITHLIGLSANIEKLKAIANQHNLILLEDCCESHGATFDSTKVGNFGLASTFSFYWGHHLTTVEGGMICTENEDLNDLFILKRSHGLARELPPSRHQRYKDQYPDIDFNFLFLTHGYNFRNTELHAVLGIEQLKHLDKYIEIRNRNHRDFTILTEKISKKLYPVSQAGISSFCLPFIFKSPDDKKKLKDELIKAEIESRPIISGNLLKQPCFKKYGDHKDFPNAQLVHENGFYIGNNQFVNTERLHQLDLIIKKVFDC
ncbi:MAG TPA: DegT/DnrJ/EryC1/StrS aminotransferase family protein [Puia sp.]|jgi:CDP-6-deoxy-D-xylo-4-hexulose-3-dehydrase|nr:DegT/DnrJ/EryC1/StrS aminotransferase family protein [Puia sp.]